MANYETYSPQDTASTTAVVEVAVAICLNSLIMTLRATESVHINGVSMDIKEVEYREDVRAFFPLGQSKMLEIMRHPF